MVQRVEDADERGRARRARRVCCVLRIWRRRFALLWRRSVGFDAVVVCGPVKFEVLVAHSRLDFRVRSDGLFDHLLGSAWSEDVR